LAGRAERRRAEDLGGAGSLRGLLHAREVGGRGRRRERLAGDRESLLPRDPPTDPERRLALVINETTRILLDTEAQQRTMLRLSLAEPERRAELPLRQGRAIRWIEDALSPLRDRMTKAELRRLVLAIRSAAGIEALVRLTDVAGLSSKEAAAVLRFSARGILRAALVDRD
jgi:hypothetical protein